MATTKRLVRKNGVPVLKFWREKINVHSRQTYSSTYPIYFHSAAREKVGHLTEEKAPRSLQEAEFLAKGLVESPETPWTMAIIYELRAMVRYGTTLDYKTYEREKATERERARMPVRLISSTATEVD